MTKTIRPARKIYDREFKIHAVELAASKTKPITQIERELEMSPGTLNKWRQQYGEKTVDAFPGKGHQGAVHSIAAARPASPFRPGQPLSGQSLCAVAGPSPGDYQHEPPSHLLG